MVGLPLAVLGANDSTPRDEEKTRVSLSSACSPQACAALVFRPLRDTLSRAEVLAASPL
jgi:hypothetical protein